MDNFQITPSSSPDYQLSAYDLPAHDLITEYETVIQTMQEQIYTLKNRLAVADDALKRKDEYAEPLNESRNVGLREKLKVRYEAEIQELSEAIRTYETQQGKLEEEKRYWEARAKALEQKYAQCLEDVEEMDAFTATTQLSAQAKSDQLARTESELQRFQEKCESLLSEVARLTEKLQQFEAIQSQQMALKSELTELEISLNKKDELLKSANKRFLVLQKKTEGLEKENQTLCKNVGNLEQERKKLTDKWQKTKSEDKMKSRVKELEDLCAQYKLTIEQSNGIVSEWERRYHESERRCKELEVSIQSYTDSIKRLKIQAKLDSNEKEMLSSMNATLSVKLHRAEEDLKHCAPTSDGSAAVRKRNEHSEDGKGWKLAGTCRGESLAGMLRGINADSEEVRELRKEVEKKDEDVRKLQSHCSRLLSRLQSLDKSDFDPPLAPAYELDCTQFLSPLEPKSLSSTLTSMLQDRKIRSTSTVRVAPLEDNKDLGRSKTPTPSQANTTRRCSNPPSPSIPKTEEKGDDTPKRSVQEVVIASHGKMRLSRRCTSEKQQWKS